MTRLLRKELKYNIKAMADDQRIILNPIGRACKGIDTIQSSFTYPCRAFGKTTLERTRREKPSWDPQTKRRAQRPRRARRRGQCLQGPRKKQQDPDHDSTSWHSLDPWGGGGSRALQAGSPRMTPGGPAREHADAIISELSLSE